MDPAKKLDAKIPEGPLAEKWTNYKGHQKLVNPANKRKLDIIVVGTGLAGASAASSLAELGFHVKSFCITDSPRRAHSVAAQGGINAAKNYQNDGDSVYRLFYDTIKGGDYRSREANVHRLAEVSADIIDQCVAMGVPFAREYGGTLANRVVVATGGYGNAYFLTTNALACNGSAAWLCYKKGAYFANPCMVQIHPTCIPKQGDYQSKLTLMSESLRNDGRIWVPKKKEDAEAIRNHKKTALDIPEEDRDYYLERRYPAFGNLVPRDVASRAAKERCDAGYGVGTGEAVYLDFSEPIRRLGREAITAKYGNLFDMYKLITDVDAYTYPMEIFPAVHFTMGGLWVDYELQTTIPGLFAIGECNYSDHGANRLGASALMQGLADGFFVLPYTMQNYLADQIELGHVDINAPEFEAAEKEVHEREKKLMSIQGDLTVDDIHKKLGAILWEHCGMSRNEASLKEGLRKLDELTKTFWTRVRIPGEIEDLNTELEKAWRLADFIEMGKLIAHDALDRKESCGAHFREEYQTEENEALRNDKDFSYVSCWAYTGEDTPPVMYKEDLNYEYVVPQTRNYKKA